MSEECGVELDIGVLWGYHYIYYLGWLLSCQSVIYSGFGHTQLWNTIFISIY